jgi:hypothetical protein
VKQPRTSKAKAPKSKKTKSAPISNAALRRQYLSDVRYYRTAARKQMFDARRSQREAVHAEGEAQRNLGIAARLQKIGYAGWARYYRRKAMRELARAKRDIAREKKHLAKARLDRQKARRDLQKAHRVGAACNAVKPAGWVLASNDVDASCVTAAVANSRLMVTGERMSAGDLQTLHRAAGTSLVTAFKVLRADYVQVRQGESLHEDGLIFEVALQYAQQHQPAAWYWVPTALWGMHAVTSYGDGVVAWGRHYRVTKEFLERQVVRAWRVRWNDVNDVKVQLPPGCSGVTVGGKRYGGIGKNKPGGSITVSERDAAAINRAAGNGEAGLLTASKSVYVRTQKKGRWCGVCRRLWHAWSVVCPKCGRDTTQEE